ncbi:MAG TPA: BlaI/MecI/CopY family transcriptional regulator [Gemmatimonadaceae bacterium]|jgi:predicted transcriptional regulator
MRVAFTDRELDVMAVLWARGSGTAAEVREALTDDFARTTVLTVLRTLQEKGYVRHAVEGRTHRYTPTVGPEAAAHSAFARIREAMFGGSHALLFAQLVADRNIDPAKLRHLRALLEARIALEEDEAEATTPEPGENK